MFNTFEFTAESHGHHFRSYRQLYCGTFLARGDRRPVFLRHLVQLSIKSENGELVADMQIAETELQPRQHSTLRQMFLQKQLQCQLPDAVFDIKFIKLLFEMFCGSVN